MIIEITPIATCSTQVVTNGVIGPPHVLGSGVIEGMNMTERNLNIEHLKTWIGKTEIQEERSCEQPIHQYYGLLNKQYRPREGEPMGPMCHYFFFKPKVSHDEIGPDGHPARGAFMPPVPLPRRMFAGSSIKYKKPLIIGERHKKVAVIEDITQKEGRSGVLVFCKVRQNFFGKDGDLALSELQNIVYREDPPKAGSVKVERAIEAPFKTVDCAFKKTITPDPVMLFRYSSSTLNTHRIHYDRKYALEVEGYPGLVVHGPLAASFLAELALEKNPGQSFRTFQFEARAPLYDTSPFQIAGKPTTNGIDLWSITPDNKISTKAKATFVNNMKGDS